MKYLFFCTFFVSVFGNAQDLDKIRAEYPIAVESSEITSKLNDALYNISPSSKPELLAYKGAILTLMAKFAKSKKDKKQYFKEGVALIESAVNSHPQNIELRYIRLSVQENSPKFLGYHKNIEDDKQFILKNYTAASAHGLKGIIKEFVLTSENFSEAEKARL